MTKAVLTSRRIAFKSSRLSSETREPETAQHANAGRGATARLRVVHLITTLDRGGAETMLSKLVSRMDPRRFESRVVSLTPPGAVRGQIERAGVRVSSLDMRRGLAGLAKLGRLAKMLRAENPDVLQTWLYHADLLGLMAGKWAGVKRVVWNVRCSGMDMQHYARASGLVLAAASRLAGFPDAIIANSQAGRRAHEQIGYRPRRWRVIANGFDLDMFRPDAGARRRVLDELHLPEGAVLIGLIARFDPMKDHETFMRAAGLLAANRPEARFLLVGRNVDQKNQTLRSAIRQQGLSDRAFLLGERSDIPALTAALDVATLSSAFGEGCPNIIGEAMACGIPCVVTHVGDAAELVGQTGRVVRPRDPVALAKAWQDLLEIGSVGRTVLGEAARRRIQRHYSLAFTVRRYQDLYEELCRE